MSFSNSLWRRAAAGRGAWKALAAVALVVAVVFASSYFSGFPFGASWTIPAKTMKPLSPFAAAVPIEPSGFHVEVFEDGRPLGPWTYYRANIVREGYGQFGVQNGRLLFSSSDNTDPAGNGRKYHVRLSRQRDGTIALAAAALAIIALAAGLARGAGPIAASRSIASRAGNAVRARAGAFASRFCARPWHEAAGIVERRGWIVLLVAPSLWVLTTCPVLWRGTDAVNQLAGRIGETTILHWPPLYNFGARAMLWIGAWFDALALGGAPPAADFLLTPAIRTTSLLALVIAQHLLLCAALAALVAAITRHATWRWLIAAIFALQGGLYLFSQAAGTESLSTPLVIAYIAVCISIFRAPRFELVRWLGCGLLLCLAILTRDINAVLAALLPLAYMLRFVLEGRLFTKGARLQGLSFAFLAVAMGLSAIFLAQGVQRAICFAAGISYYSRFGYTFQWRLQALGYWPAGERESYLHAVSRHAGDPMVRQVILDLAGNAGPAFDVCFPFNDFKRRIQSQGAGVATVLERQASLKMNALARAFLKEPHPYLTQIVARDLRQGFARPISSLALEPIESTNQLTEMGALQSYGVKLPLLSTGSFGPAFEAYLRFWAWCPYWLIVLVALALISWGLLRRRPGDSVDMALCLSLLLTGILAYFLNNVCSSNFPRFQLNLLILLLAATAVAAARIAARSSSKTASTRHANPPIFQA